MSTNTKTVRFDIDKDFDKVGEFGPYQLLVFVLVGLTACIPAIIVHAYVFVSATPEFRCQIPNLDNDTYEIQNDFQNNLIKKFIPMNSIDSSKYDRCYLNVYQNDSTFENISSLSIRKEKCSKWVFSDKIYKKTIATDWELVCDKAPKKSGFSSLYFFGTYCILFIGVYSDIYGRKLCAYCVCLANLLVHILITILVNIKMELTIKEILFSILRFLMGGASNTYSLVVVLAIEITGPKYRVMASNVIYYFYILGEYISVLLCYFVRDYDNIYIWTTVIFGIYPLYFWLVPESPRWLIAKGRDTQAYKILNRIAKSNNKNLPKTYESFLLEKKKSIEKGDTSQADEDLNQNEVVKVGFLNTVYAFLKSKTFLIRTLAIAFNWLTNNLVYYGITLGAGQLAGDPFLNVTLLATTELIAIICSQYAFVRFGRKIPYIINMAVTGFVLLIVYFIPKSLSFLVTIIALVGKFTISFTFGGVYIVTSELFPTTIRQTSLSLCQIVGKIGAIISPYINLLGELYYEPLPFMIYGACAIIATVAIFFFVPETKDSQLPNTIDDTN